MNTHTPPSRAPGKGVGGDGSAPDSPGSSAPDSPGGSAPDSPGGSAPDSPGGPAPDSRGGSRRRTQAERRRQTRQALLGAALLQIEAGDSFDSLSLRSVARAAGVVPTAFYRHFGSMDELGLALVEESFRTLRAMLRQAREGQAPANTIRRSVEILVDHVKAHRQHFVFVVRVGYTGNAVLRHAVRNEIRLFTSELATDLARFPILREWTTGDLQMLAGQLVNTMIATVGAMVDGPVAAPEAEVEIARVAEKQLRLTMLAVPHWRSRPATA